MTRKWVTDKILELYTDDGLGGKLWARKLAAAWREGRLKGVVYKTPVEAGQAGETLVHSRPEFGRQHVRLPEGEP